MPGTGLPRDIITANPNITGGEAWNPVAQIEYAEDKQTQDKIVADLHADFKPFKFLKLTSRLYVDYAYQKQDIFNDKNFYGIDPLVADSNTNVSQDMGPLVQIRY